MQIFALWAVSDKSYGGLSFSSQDVGEVLTISGAFYHRMVGFKHPLHIHVNEIFELTSSNNLACALRTWSFDVPASFIPADGKEARPSYGHAPVSSNVPLTHIFFFTFMAVSIPLLACFPFIAMLSGLVLHLVVNLASILRNTLSVSLVTGLFILQNDAVAQSERAAANGISLTAMSVFKAFGPAGGGALFSWAQKRQVAAFLPGDQMVFFVLNLVQGIGLILTFKPFLAQPNLPSVASN
ncbi:unnamed protein product [Linum tenue]|uniref:Uncharacterized protein n=1 Tax=Linum tenue TaxID=586396 RepID=A0AAV0N3W9_9ROSI|nr:unnamed protein product [Linum tenue]